MIARGLEAEAIAPKYAAIERERRFLVDTVRLPDLSAATSVRIEDRYIDGTRLRLRRMTDSATGRVILKLGKKYEAADPLARPVVTTYLTVSEFALLATLPATTLAKRAYRVDVNNVTFRVDRFEGVLSGLILAEVEAGDDARLREVGAPEWAVREVSDDPAFDGVNLAGLTNIEDLAVQNEAVSIRS